MLYKIMHFPIAEASLYPLLILKAFNLTHMVLSEWALTEGQDGCFGELQNTRLGQRCPIRD